MQSESRKYLWDAVQAADRITRFVSGKAFEVYRQDDLLRSGVERQFEIIGESLAQLSRLAPPASILSGHGERGAGEALRVLADFQARASYNIANLPHHGRIAWSVDTPSLPARRNRGSRRCCGSSPLWRCSVRARPARPRSPGHWRERAGGLRFTWTLRCPRTLRGSPTPSITLRRRRAPW